MRKAMAWDEIAKDKRLGSQLTTSQLADAGEKAKTNRDGGVEGGPHRMEPYSLPVKSETGRQSLSISTRSDHCAGARGCSRRGLRQGQGGRRCS